jgi:hypothetical protein
MKKHTTTSYAGPHPYSKQSWYSIGLSAILFAAFLLFSPSSFAAEPCEGKESVTSNCLIGLVGKCIVCEAPESNWEHPRIDVYYKTWLSVLFGVGWYSPMSLEDGQCDDRVAMRFCARRAFPGYEKDGTAENNYGNKTGATNNPRVQLCAYEDPLDGMDTTWGSSPYHHNTPNEAMANSTSPAVYGAVFGGFGALVGGIVGAIMAKHNHVVVTDLGCVELPVAKGPPPFCNNCWHTKYTMPPFIGLGYESTFFDPKVTLNFCFKNKTVKGIATKESVKCEINKTTKEITPNLNTITLSPVGPSYKAAKAVNFTYNQNGEEVRDQREFSAEISTGNPSQICVFMTKNISGTEIAPVAQGCVQRPGYMPMPLMSRSPASTIEEPRISVTFKEGSSEKIEVSQSTANLNNACKTLNQITICAERKCIDGGDASLGSCTTWDDKVCLIGYNTVPLVVADGIKNIPIAAGVKPPNNIMRVKDTLLENKYAYPEVGKKGEADQFPKIKLLKDALFYENPGCDKMDEDGKCIKRNGVAVTKDDYYIDSDFIDSEKRVPKQVLRQLTPEELGLCIPNPVDADVMVKTKAGTYVYSVPKNCKQIKVELWGAGAGGTTGGATGDDHGGGAGGYVSALATAKDGDKFDVIVGAGGLRKSNGGDSSISHAATLIATANGGQISSASGTGGASSCTAAAAECTLKKSGGNGFGASCSYMKGGAVWNPDTGNYVFSGFGVTSCDNSIPTVSGTGGCAGDSCSGSGVSANGAPGADGKARVSCVSFGSIN